MLKIDREKVTPICPHCEKELDRLVEIDRGFIYQFQVFCCPLCHKIIGITKVQ